SISRILAPTYDCDPGSVPTSTVPRPGVTPRSLSFETRFVRSSFICAAVARPSSFSAVIWWRRPLSIGIDLHPSPASGLCTQCNDQPADCHRLHLNYDTTKKRACSPGGGSRPVLELHRPTTYQPSSPSYSGNSSASFSVRARNASTSGLGFNACAMMSETSVNSAEPKPRVASAGVPIRRPEVVIGGRGSHGTELRLTVMPTSSRMFSPC